MPQSNSSKENTAVNAAGGPRLVFRYRYILFPCLLALVCVILLMVFYNRMPAELGLRFASDGTPKTLMSKNAFVFLMLGIQIGIVAVASIISAIFLKIARSVTRNSPTSFDLSGFIAIMSNMLLLPQLILAYIMLDSFIYGIQGTHGISLLAFSLLTVGIGSIVIVILFVRLFIQSRRTANNKK